MEGGGGGYGYTRNVLRLLLAPRLLLAVTALVAVAATAASAEGGKGHAAPLGSPVTLTLPPTPGTVWELGYSEGSPLSSISLASGHLGTPVQITSGFDDDALAITPNGKTAYVAQNVTNTVVSVSLATGANGGLINVGQEATAIAITPDGQTAYVVTGGPQLGPSGVVPIDTATNTAGATINAGILPNSIAISPDGQTAYVVNVVSDSLTPIDLATDKPESPIYPITSPYNGGSELAGIAITPNGKTAYVVNDRWESNTPNEVVPVNLATGKAGKPIALGDPQGTPLNIAIAPNGLHAYVTEIVLQSGNGSAVIPIDLTTGVAGAPINLTIGGKSSVVVEPWAIAITPDNRVAYVADEGVGWVTPINLTTDSAEPPIRTGYKSEAVAIAPDQAPVAAFSVQLAPAGSPSTFNGSASTSSTSPIATRHWDFGDGTGRSTSAPLVQHTYAHPGRYVVTLTVTDKAGTSTTPVFTGQTMSNNGGPQARTERKIKIKGRSVAVP
jgi:DNA-binding beta-propeller fold protein YncE